MMTTAGHVARRSLSGGQVPRVSTYDRVRRARRRAGRADRYRNASMPSLYILLRSRCAWGRGAALRGSSAFRGSDPAGL